jgi:zinc D-Ala-D-Ala carboxypeptidase
MYNIPESMKLSKNFALSEFACNDGSKEMIVDYELIERLQKFRDALGKSITITSGYRSVAYNQKCGGIKTSLHLLGKAADIKISGMTPLQVAKEADKYGFLGIGVYPTFTHVDVGGSTTGKKIYWKQNSKGIKSFVDSL